MDGIRVHDVASMYAGPVVVTFLADLGAVEPPGGDALRHFAFGGVSHLRRTTEHESAGPQVGEHTEEILSGELGLVRPSWLACAPTASSDDPSDTPRRKEEP